jgi:hypothetical protein
MAIFVFKEIMAYNSKVCHSTPNNRKRTVKSPLELLGIFVCPLAKIPFVDTAR